MPWNDYQLRHPAHVGSAGIVYEASGPEGAAVLVWVRDSNQTVASWPRLSRRLRQAALLTHAAVVAVRELGLDAEPSFVTLERLDAPSLSEALTQAGPLPARRAVELIRDLADVLAAAHRLGLTHGGLSPHSIRCTTDGQLKLEFTGLVPIPAEPNRCDFSFRLPETELADGPTPAADLFALGAVIGWLVARRSLTDSAAADAPPTAATIPGLPVDAADFTALHLLQNLAGELSRGEPSDRPSAQEVANRLQALLAPAGQAADLQATMASVHAPAAEPEPVRAAVPARLGRYRLQNKLGEGGMGTVYRADDVTDGTTVAVKLLRPELARQPAALRRFEKEARMLATVRSPYVANLLDVNEQDGVHYLAMEFVAGRSLRAVLDEKGKLDEPDALQIMADVCRALGDAHALGVVHRDVKPENILLTTEPAHGSRRVKLTDFGLAREVEQSASMDLTRDNLIGTPLYMAPEQGQGGSAVDARTDVYAVGATLFHMLAGKPPFSGGTPVEVLMKHANAPLPRLTALNPAVSDAAVRIVERALAKRPNERFADARDMLRELERVQRGEPATLAVHPLLPTTTLGQVREFVFSWDLAATPEQLWPHVSNTERLNRAIGLPAVRFTTRAERGRVRRFAEAKKIGLVGRWEEHPFEWVEGRRFGVLREFSRGPFAWITSVVELTPRDGGTTLTHTFRLEPRGWLGKVVAAVELGIRTSRALDRVYRRIDAVLINSAASLADHFEEGPKLSGGRMRRLESALARLTARGVAPAVAEALGEFLAQATDPSVARIRPLSVASRLALDPAQFVDACLLAASEGLLVLMWDILCPVCRIPSQIHDSLKVIREHGHCEACNLDFELDFANSVETIFRVHPEIRPSELGTFCIGGPAHSPHVAAQVRIAAGERIELALGLGEGAYRLRGPQLPYVVDFRVVPGARTRRWDFPLSRRPGDDLPRALAEGDQMLALRNDSGQELVVRVERTAPRSDALTAARAAALPLFRELFPDERLAPGMLVSVSQVTFLVTDLVGVGRLYREQGDAKAFAGVHEQLLRLEQVVKGQGGAVVKVVGAGLMAAFHEPAAAVRAALAMPAALATSDLTRGLQVRYAIHRGPAFTATINDRLDYFGATAALAASLPTAVGPGELVLTRAVAADVQVAELLDARGLRCDVIDIDFPDSPERFAHRLVRAGP